MTVIRLICLCYNIHHWTEIEHSLFQKLHSFTQACAVSSHRLRYRGVCRRLVDHLTLKKLYNFPSVVNDAEDKLIFHAKYYRTTR
jgi:hypothetical protein